MNTRSMESAHAHVEPQASWMPMVVIAMAQIMMVFNVSTMQVSIDGIASSFNAPATSVGTAIVTYSLVVAGFIMLGSRVAQMFGSRRVFRVMVLCFGAAMALAAFSHNVVTMLLAQILAGVAAAVLVPTLVVLIADNYSGHQQATALGLLGAAVASGIVLAFLIAGYLATAVHWRATYVMLAVLAGIVYAVSARLAPIESHANIGIDKVGIVLVAAAVLLISLGSNNLTDWGILLAQPEAPFSVFGMSPAPVMILIGIFLVQAFLAWSRHRHRTGGTPLLSLEVLDTPAERSALLSLFIISALASAITFLIPLYIQVVQGRSSLETAIAVIPFSVASLAAAVLVVRLYPRVPPNRIARFGFLFAAFGVALLGVVIRNEWSDLLVILGMAMTGLAEGALMTLMFNVLVTASPKSLAGDVGSLRGVANNLAAAVGTAVAGALVVGLLTTSVHRELVDNGRLPNALRAEFDLDKVAFVSNDRLREVLARTAATPAQVDEAVRINTDTRLLALKVTFFTLASMALLAFFPAGGLPNYVSGDVPREVPEDDTARSPPATVPAA